MKGILTGDKVVFGAEAVPELHEASYYGRQKDGRLELALVEAAYLLDREKIVVVTDDQPLSFRGFFVRAAQAQEYFELKYIVYRDLRERGYFVQPSVTDFRVYPRGGKPGVAPSRRFVHVVSERKPLPMAALVEQLQAAANVRREMVLAIVDEESDITYYGVKTTTLKGSMGPLDLSPSPGSATFLEDRVVVWDREVSARLHEEGFYGNMMDVERLQLSLVESAYLIMRDRLAVADTDGKAIGLDDFVARAREIEPAFERKLKVYADLRDRGLVVKTGFKFGSHFRVYEQVKSVKKVPHSRYLVDALDYGHEFQLQDLSQAVRLAHSVRKEMAFAYEKDGIHYFSLGRIKL